MPDHRRCEAVFTFGCRLEDYADETEQYAFWTYSRKYCNNPKRHIFGSLPCCAGLHITQSGVDPRDFLSLPFTEKPLITIQTTRCGA